MPTLIQGNEAFRRNVLQISQTQFADKVETKNHFDRMMDMFQQQLDREAKKWEAQEKRWAAQEKRWTDQEKRWTAWEQKWEIERLEQQKKWEANQEAINNVLAEVKAMNQKHESTIGALGSRWGLHSEAAFRNALKGILKDISSDIEVLNVNEYDDEGMVYGHPDQVELDIIIKNGRLLVCEIKSSMGKAAMYIFERKVRFYENRHHQKVDKILVISPMVDDRAKVVAKKLGIEIYSYAEDVNL